MTIDPADTALVQHYMGRQDMGKTATTTTIPAAFTSHPNVTRQPATPRPAIAHPDAVAATQPPPPK